jgi:hypothetical protein
VSESTEFFIIMTVEKPIGGGYQSGTFRGVVTPEQAGRTRAEMYAWMLGQLPDQLQGGNVVFFSAEPNRVFAEAVTA